jgi:hypothetical protein
LVTTTDEPDTGVLRVHPTGGGQSITLAPSGTSLRFDVTQDSSAVIFGANEDGSTADLTLIPIGGGSSQLLVPGASDNGFRTMRDGTTFVYLMPDDSLHAMNLDGSNERTLVPTGVIDTSAETTDALIGITQIGTTGLASLTLIHTGATGMVALGSSAIDEGFTDDGAYYFFRDLVQSSGAGTLRSVDVTAASIGMLAMNVVRVVIADDRRAIFLDTAGVLQLGDASTGGVSPIQSGVGSFSRVPDGFGMHASRVAYAIRSGPSAGIYLASL